MNRENGSLALAIKKLREDSLKPPLVIPALTYHDRVQLQLQLRARSRYGHRHPRQFRATTITPVQTFPQLLGQNDEILITTHLRANDFALIRD